jgi:hypothetical protein
VAQYSSTTYSTSSARISRATSPQETQSGQVHPGCLAWTFPPLATASSELENLKPNKPKQKPTFLLFFQPTKMTTTDAKVIVHVFCEGCGKEVDASSYPDKPSICVKCDKEKEETSDTDNYIDLTELSYFRLCEEYEDICDARKQHSQGLKEKEWTEADKAFLRKMDSWAKRVVEEISKRM